MNDFTFIKRSTLKELKAKYQHAQDKKFYTMANEEYSIHLILGDSTYCKIRTEQVFKGLFHNRNSCFHNVNQFLNFYQGNLSAIKHATNPAFQGYRFTHRPRNRLGHWG